MSLRSKSFILLTLIFGLYAVLDNFVQQRLVFPTFATLERDEALNDAHRCVEALNGEARAYGEALHAWSQAQQVERFITTHNPKVIEAELTLARMRDLDANFVAFANTNGDVLWSRALELESGRDIDMSEYAAGTRLSPSLLSARAPKGTRAGVVDSAAGPLIMGVTAVSSERGIVGYALLGRRIDNALLSALEAGSRVDFELAALSASLAPDDNAALKELAASFESTYHVADGSLDEPLRVYTTIAGLDGHPALMLRADIARNISLRGTSAIQYAQGSLLALAVFVLLFAVLGAEKMVLSRIERLSRFCRAVQHRGPSSARLHVDSSDELGQLARDINNMYDELELKNRLLDEALAESQEATEAKSEFLAVMSHEIRTPMNGVLGMLGVLANTQLSADQYEHLAVAQESAENLLRLLNDILDFSKIEAGKLEIEEIEFSLPLLIEDNMRVSQLKAKEKGIELITDVSPEIPEQLVGDPGRVRQILSNLLNNAVKFTHSGYVAVSATVAEQDAESVTLMVNVHDSGIGIPAERIDRLFRSFSQVDASTTRNYGGSGLGLAICSTLAEMMGGQCGVESEEGRGSTFWFTLKLKREHDKPRCRPLPLSELKGHSVLVVDDSTINRRVMSLQLSKWGLLVAEAAGGREALEMLRAAARAGQPYEVCILDFIMPGLNGQELGQAILSDDQISSSRLVLVTSAGQRGDANKFHSMGYSAYLTKPISQNQLVECVATVLGTEPAQVSQARPPLVTKYSLAENQADVLRVLLAEDNRVNQKVAVALLSRAGHRVDIVESGRAALDAMRREHYDLVLMDVHMPELDGFQATQLIRRLPGRAGAVPIIAMTARAMEGDRQICLDSGMDDYLSKPVNPVELYAAIDRQRHLMAERFARFEGQPEEPRRQRPDLSLLTDAHAGALRFGGESDTGTWSGDVVLSSEPMDIPLSISHIGEREFWLQLVEVFLEEMPRRITQLGEWIDAGNAEEVENAAHSIKGSCAEMLAEPMRQTAQALELCGREHNLVDAPVLFEELQARYRALAELLQVERALVA